MTGMQFITNNTLSFLSDSRKKGTKKDCPAVMPLPGTAARNRERRNSHQASLNTKLVLLEQRRSCLFRLEESRQIGGVRKLRLWKIYLRDYSVGIDKY